MHLIIIMDMFKYAIFTLFKSEQRVKQQLLYVKHCEV